jgi:phosphate transport system substrate-binding protein
MVIIKSRLIKSLTLLTFALSLNACGNDQAKEGVGQNGEPPSITVPFTSPLTLTGAGATFPAPLYQNWFVLLNRLVPNLRVNYQSVGSGAGIEQFTRNTVDFGASDVAMSDEQIKAVSRGVFLLPVTAGSIVFAYNLPGVEGLKLSRETYVGIALGTITRWNDPKIVADNPDLTLPDRSITFVHRSDGSGTTGVFTKHLADISPEWSTQIGQGTSVQWGRQGATFLGGRGNEGVTAIIQQNQGSIGYVEYGFAKKNNIPMAILENKEGNFITPSEETGTNALANVELPENLRAFISDPPGENSYPIVTYTWILAYQKYDDPNKAIAMEAMIQYALTYGQDVASELGYIPLPQNVTETVSKVADQISPDFTITVN